MAQGVEPGKGQQDGLTADSGKAAMPERQAEPLSLAGEVECHSYSSADRDPDTNTHRDIVHRRAKTCTKRHTDANACTYPVT